MKHICWKQHLAWIHAQATNDSGTEYTIQRKLTAKPVAVLCWGQGAQAAPQILPRPP